MDTKLRERILEHLKSKGTFDEKVDEMMLDDLLENLEFTKKIFKELRTEGSVIEYTMGNGHIITKLNPKMNAYQMMQKNVFQLCSKLGINRNDRLKLKLIEKQEKDEFEKLFNN